MMNCSGKSQALTHRFNTPLILEKPVLTPDGGGGNDEQWVFVSNVWGQVITQNAKESVQDDRLIMRKTHHIYMRPQNTISATMRFVDQQKHYYITGYYLENAKKENFSLEQSQKFLLCHCEEFDVF